MSKPVFLDVDSSIVEQNLRINKNSEEDDLAKLFEQKNYPSKLVKPSPGFCIKTRELTDKGKVFVNICQTDAIPPPKDITTKELQEILESDEPGDYRVPMSIGEIRTENDKKGEKAKVCDVAVNPAFFKKVTNIPEFKNFFLAIVFHGLQDKYNLEFVDEKIILQNRKVFGTLQTHRIQQREIEQKMAAGDSNSLLSAFGDKGHAPSKKPLIETISSVDSVTKEPPYRLYKKKDGQNCLYGEFQLPDVISIKEITLDIGEDRILLESKLRGYLLDLFVPYIIKQKNCASTFNKTSKVLKVTMPLVGG